LRTGQLADSISVKSWTDYNTFDFLYTKQKPNTNPNPIDYRKCSLVYFTANHIYSNYLP